MVTTNFFFFAVQKGTVVNFPLFVRDVLDFSVTEVSFKLELNTLSTAYQANGDGKVLVHRRTVSTLLCRPF